MVGDDEGRGQSRVATNTGSHQTLEEAGNGRRPRASRVSVAWSTPWFWPSDIDLGFLPSRTEGEYISIVLSHQAGGKFIIATTGN